MAFFMPKYSKKTQIDKVLLKAMSFRCGKVSLFSK